MRRFPKVMTTLLLGITLATISAMADVKEGQKIYIKELKTPCHMSGSDFAAKHSQDEWEALYDAGKLNDEIHTMCGKKLEEKLLPHVYDFAYEYANDAGNVPSC